MVCAIYSRIKGHHFSNLVRSLFWGYRSKIYVSGSIFQTFPPKARGPTLGETIWVCGVMDISILPPIRIHECHLNLLTKPTLQQGLHMSLVGPLAYSLELLKDSVSIFVGLSNRSIRVFTMTGPGHSKWTLIQKRRTPFALEEPSTLDTNCSESQLSM